jgi:hypothetical protein
MLLRAARRTEAQILEIHSELPGRVHIVLIKEPVGY